MLDDRYYKPRINLSFLISDAEHRKLTIEFLRVHFKLEAPYHWEGDEIVQYVSGYQNQVDRDVVGKIDESHRAARIVYEYLTKSE